MASRIFEHPLANELLAQDSEAWLGFARKSRETGDHDQEAEQLQRAIATANVSIAMSLARISHVLYDGVVAVNGGS